MRWFKHMCQTRTDERMAMFFDKCGWEGYGVYFGILEIISSLMCKENGWKTEVTYPIKRWSSMLALHRTKMRKYLGIMVDAGLLLVSYSADTLSVNCPNLLKYKDEYTKKSRQCPDNVPTMSGQTPRQYTETETEKEKKKDNSVAITKTDTHNRARGSYSSSDSSSDCDKIVAVAVVAENEKVSFPEKQKINHLEDEQIPTPLPNHYPPRENATTLNVPPKDLIFNLYQQVVDYFLKEFPTFFTDINQMHKFWVGAKARGMLAAWQREDVTMEDIYAAVQEAAVKGRRSDNPIYYADATICFARERKKFGKYKSRGHPLVKTQKERDEENRRLEKEITERWAKEEAEERERKRRGRT